VRFPKIHAVMLIDQTDPTKQHIDLGILIEEIEHHVERTWQEAIVGIRISQDRTAHRREAFIQPIRRTFVLLKDELLEAAPIEFENRPRTIDRSRIHRDVGETRTVINPHRINRLLQEARLIIRKW
jgi:hypothetical protein